jgi:hypothetical protein
LAQGFWLGSTQGVEDGEQSRSTGAVRRVGGTVGVEQGSAAIQEEISAELQDVFSRSGQSGPVAA